MKKTRKLLTAAVIAAGLLSQTVLAQVFFTEDFEIIEGDNGVGTRYTMSGQGYFPPGTNGQDGAIYWDHSSNIPDGVGLDFRTQARRALITWDDNIPQEAVTQDAIDMLTNVLDWLLEGRPATATDVYFLTNINPGTGDQVIFDILNGMGYNNIIVNDGIIPEGATDPGIAGNLFDTSLNPPPTPPDNSTIALFIGGPTAGNDSALNNLGQSPVPLLTYNISSHDDQLIGNIGNNGNTQTIETVRIDTNDGIAGDVAGDLVAGVDYDWVTGPQGYATFGGVFGPGSTTVASGIFQGLVAVPNLATVDAMLDGTRPSLAYPPLTESADQLIEADISTGGGGGGAFGGNAPIPTPPDGLLGGFATVGTGAIQVNTAGTYSFALGSDDGSRLRIDLNRDGDFEDAGESLAWDRTGGFAFTPGQFTFPATGSYDIEWVAFNSAGGFGAEVWFWNAEASSAEGTPLPEVPAELTDDLIAWLTLFDWGPQEPIQLSGNILIRTYILDEAPEEIEAPLIVVYETDAQLIGGGLFNGQSGEDFIAASATNKFPYPDAPSGAASPDEYRLLTIGPIDVTGREALELRVLWAGSDLDFESTQIDAARVFVDIDESGTYNAIPVAQVLPTGTGASDLSDGNIVLRPRFQTGVYPLPQASSSVTLQFRVGTTFFNELIAFDRVQIAEVTAPEPTGLIPVAEIPAQDGTGLAGRFWNREPETINNIAGQAELVINLDAPDGRFTATTLSYASAGLDPVSTFLGADYASMVFANASNPPDVSDVEDTVFSFTGYIAIPGAGTVLFGSPSDDASKVWIGGELVIDNDGTHGSPGPAPSGTATFSAAGLYPIKIDYYNGQYIDGGGTHGGASFAFTVNEAAVDVTTLYPVEVGSPNALFIGGFAGNTTPTDADAATIARLEALTGLPVIATDDEAAYTAENATDDNVQVVYIASSSNSGAAAAGAWTSSGIPVVNAEAFVQDDFFTATPGNADGDSIVISDDTHPLAGGLAAGTYMIKNTVSQLHIGSATGAEAVVAGQVVDNTAQALIYGYDTGAILTDLETAIPARFVHMGIVGDAGFIDLTANGLLLWDAGVSWALGSDTPFVVDEGPTGPVIDAITLAGGMVEITWGGGETLLEADDVAGPYTEVTGATSPFMVDPSAGGNKYYQLQE